MHELPEHNISVRNKWTSGEKLGGDIVSTNDYPPKMGASHYSIHFSSMPEYIEYLKTTQPIGVHQSSVDHGGGEIGDSWVDTKTYNDAVNYAEVGSIEHREKYTALVQKLETKLGESETFTKRIEYGMAGAYPDVARYVAGEPCHMVIPFGQRDKPVIKIGVPINAMCSINGQTLFNYGAALLCIIDYIEQSGSATVELTAVGGNRCRSTSVSWVTSYPLKRAGEVLSIDAMAFQFCSSSALRRLSFRLTESLPDKAIADRICSYGQPMATTTDTLSQFDNVGLTMDVMLPIVKHNMNLMDCWNDIKNRLADSSLQIKI